MDKVVSVGEYHVVERIRLNEMEIHLEGAFSMWSSDKMLTFLIGGRRRGKMRWLKEAESGKARYGRV